MDGYSEVAPAYCSWQDFMQGPFRGRSKILRCIQAMTGPDPLAFKGVPLDYRFRAVAKGLLKVIFRGLL